MQPNSLNAYASDLNAFENFNLSQDMDEALEDALLEEKREDERAKERSKQRPVSIFFFPANLCLLFLMLEL